MQYPKQCIVQTVAKCMAPEMSGHVCISLANISAGTCRPPFCCPASKFAYYWIPVKLMIRLAEGPYSAEA